MPLDDLTTPQGLVAVGAAALALLALVVAAVLAARLRRIRKAQAAVLGGHERRDLVAHAERIENGFVELRDWVEESMRRLDEQTAAQSARLDGCVAYRALVRYDAYEEMSGQQSSSLALLDARRSGTVVSSINHRDQARVYVKQVHEGQPELPLSPEEQQAVENALSSAGVGHAAPAAESRSSA
jgi:hypothetical protein